MSEKSFREQIETNLFGVVNVTKAALPLFRQQRSGHFLQFSSIGGRVGGTPGMGAYQSAKFAVEGFSEVLNAEVKPLGIKVKRAANILLTIVDLEGPPLRLLLGDGAARSADTSSRARAAEAEQWADLRRSADLPDGEYPGVSTESSFGSVFHPSSVHHQ